MRYSKMFEVVKQEGRIDGRDEARTAIRARLIAGGMSPKEADKFVNPVLAGAN